MNKTKCYKCKYEPSVECGECPIWLADAEVSKKEKIAYQQGKTDAIDEYKKKIEFVEEWLFDCKVFNPEVTVAFDTLKRYAEHLKRRIDNGSD